MNSCVLMSPGDLQEVLHDLEITPNDLPKVPGGMPIRINRRQCLDKET